jgi:hypothetical protein
MDVRGSSSNLGRWKNYFCQLFNVQGQVMLDTLKCIYQSNLCQSLTPLRLRSLLETLEGISHQVLIRFQQK